MQPSKYYALYHFLWMMVDLKLIGMNTRQIATRLAAARLPKMLK